MTHSSRRQFLAGSCRVGTAVALGLGDRWAESIGRIARLLDPPPLDPFANGRKLASLRFMGETGRRLERRTGRGLSGRYTIDLARLDDDALVIPRERFFIRTAAPDRLDLTKPWRVRVRGLVERPEAIPIERFNELAGPRGVHLLECSGNVGSFGLMSAAEWDGVPVTEILDTLKPARDGLNVLVSGFDDHSGEAKGSRRGASWVFTREQLEQTGAFFATRMNGEPLSRDHGQPVRLIVPGWYGCTCIKWVDEIRLVGDGQRATSQMREYARRTHQRGQPRLARDYRPAEIDLAAMPIRVEKWRVDGGIVYRVVGILWGGTKTTDALTIRFSRGVDGAFQRNARDYRVDHCEHTTNQTWTLWWHAWKPTAPGEYRITMHIDDPAIRTRRLDRGYYARTVEIDQV